MKPRHIPQRPAIRDIERANAAMHRVLHSPRVKYIDQGEAPGGWRWWIAPAFYDETVFHVSAERPGARDSMEYATLDECRAWVGRLVK